MDIWQINKLTLFLIFFIPGFISIKIYDLLVPTSRDFSKSLFEAIGYSSLNFAALSWLIILIHSGGFYDGHKELYFIWLFCVLFIFPILWPFLVSKLLKSRILRKNIIHPVPKPWDYVFGKRESFWVIVHLKDGRRIGGKYDTNSFASSYPAEEQIYLESVWKLDENGCFKEPIKGSRGTLISGREILSLEFLE